MRFPRPRNRKERPARQGKPQAAAPPAGGREGDDPAAGIAGHDLHASSEGDLRARIADASAALGAAPPDEARLAAVERLTELKAEGKVSEENYQRERRRLLGG